MDEVLKSYLVSLGFAVDHPAVAKFNDTLKKASEAVELAMGEMVGAAASAGIAIVGAMATASVAVVGLMNHVAQADLGFQVYARRMFMSVDAAKALKIATDALGYSLEDIIWGPKELRERFGVLMQDQRDMHASLPADYELQMRHIRDIRFEFTRMNMVVEELSRRFVYSLMRSLFGASSDDDLLKKLRGHVEFLKQYGPQIIDIIATKVSNFLKDTYHALQDIYNVLNKIDSILKFLMGRSGEEVKGERVLGGMFTVEKGGATERFDTGLRGTVDQARAAADYISKKTGIAADLIFGQFAHETANFSHIAAENNLAGIRKDGHYRKFSSTQEFADFLANLLTSKYPGALGAQDPKTYAHALTQGKLGSYYYPPREDIYAAGIKRGEAGYTINGGVNVHVHEPKATPEQVHHAVTKALDDKLGKRTQRNIAQFGGPVQ